MAIEMVILTPVLVMFVMMVVALGRYVAVKGDVEAASRDAARAASLERDLGTAGGAARSTAKASLDTPKWDCTDTDTSTNDGDAFTPGSIVTVTLSCQVPWNDLGLIGLHGSMKVSATSEAPLDLYRRSGP